MISKCLHNKGLGLLLLRIGLGCAFVMHGYAKVTNIEGTHMFFTAIGLSSIVWTYLAAYGEFLGGIALIVGLFTRYAAIVVSIVVAVAIGLVLWPHGYGSKGGYEYEALLLLASLALLFTGAGKYSLDAKFMHKCDNHCQNGDHCGESTK